MRAGIKTSKLIDSHRIGEHNENTKLKYGKLVEISIRNNSRISFNFTKDELKEAKWDSKKQIINVLKPHLPSPTIKFRSNTCHIFNNKYFWFYYIYK